MKHSYHKGTPVFHLALKKQAKVIDLWWDGLQTRYLVRHSGWDWSVPEVGLREVTARSKPANSVPDKSTNSAPKALTKRKEG